PGTSLANGYWGVRPSGAGQKASLARESSAVQPSAVPAGSATPSEMSSGPSASPSIARERPPTSPWLLRYARALGIAFPWYLWLFVLPGLAAPGRDRRPGLSGDRANRRRFDLEALVAIPLIATSVLIARIVAIDPRTQLFLAPLAAFYAARGVLLVSDLAAKRLEGRVRPEMVPRALVGALVIVLLGTSVSRLVLSLTVGSPHHVVAAENAAVGAAIRRSTPEDVTVMSFHPAVALFADRDW